MHKYANPARFSRIANAILPWTFALMLITFGAGLYYALYASPPDYQQGETVRIMYIHVPSAAFSLSVYGFMALASVVFLIWKHPLAALAAKAAAPIGLLFTGLALITGSVWGKPMWGAWWVWDARLTSVLVQFFLILGYMALWQVMEDNRKAAKASAIIAIVGAINLPIIKFSVDWWNTLHQPAGFLKFGPSTLDDTFELPLMIMLAAYLFYFITVLLWRLKAEISERRLEQLARERSG